MVLGEKDDVTNKPMTNEREQRTVEQALHGITCGSDITGALTVPVLVQFVLLHHRLQGVQLQPGVPDQLQWRWSANGAYLSCSAYAALLLGQITIPGAQVLWNSRAPNKCQFFVWLALLRCCWTADRRCRRGLQTDNS
jgi:hypothetical protein